MKIATLHEVERKHDVTNGLIGAGAGAVLGYVITAPDARAAGFWVLPSMVLAIVGYGLGVWLGPLLLKG